MRKSVSDKPATTPAPSPFNIIVKTIPQLPTLVDKNPAPPQSVDDPGSYYLPLHTSPLTFFPQIIS